MICSNCCKTFDGKGSYCPDCKPAAERQHSFATAAVHPAEAGGIYPAGMAGRIVAFLFDSLVMIFTFSVALTAFAGVLLTFMVKALTVALSGFKGGMVMALFLGSIASFIATILLAILFTPIYYVVFETSRWQATPGKILVGQIVTDSNGNKLTILRSFLRVCARWIGALPIYFALFIPFISEKLNLPGLNNMVSPMFLLGAILTLITYPMAFFSSYGQGLHDWASGCVVQEKDGEDYTKGFLFALITVIIAVVLLFYFTPQMERSGNFQRRPRNIQNLSELNAEFEKLGAIMEQKIARDLEAKGLRLEKQPPAKLSFEPRQPIVMEQNNAPVSKQAQPDIELTDQMSAAVEGRIIKFERVSANLGATRRTLSLSFYQAGSSQPDFRVALFFRWPLSGPCKQSDLERYEITFLKSQADKNFALPDGMKNVTLSRYGNPPEGELLSLNCAQKGDTIEVKGRFKGRSDPMSHGKSYIWNISADTGYKLR